MVDSATSQFFINTGTNNGFLDHKVRDYGYAVFGKVVGGMDVVDKIEGVKTATGRCAGRAGDHQEHPGEVLITRT